MKEALVITGYCSIYDRSVVVDGKLLYRGREVNPGELYTDIYRHFGINYPKFHKMDMLSRLGFVTADILIREKHTTERYEGSETGIILMNSSSSLDTDRNHQRSISDRTEYFPSPAVFVYTLPNVVIGEICIRHRITGEGNFFVMEQFNPLFMVNYISQLFDNKIIETCISGWVEHDGDNYESLLFLIEKRDRTEGGIVNFEPAAIQSIYNSK
jgi:hypothetical protein